MYWNIDVPQRHFEDQDNEFGDCISLLDQTLININECSFIDGIQLFSFSKSSVMKAHRVIYKHLSNTSFMNHKSLP